MSDTTLFIDGENLKHYIKRVFRENDVDDENSTILKIDLSKLFSI